MNLPHARCRPCHSHDIYAFRIYYVICTCCLLLLFFRFSFSFSLLLQIVLAFGQSLLLLILVGMMITGWKFVFPSDGYWKLGCVLKHCIPYAAHNSNQSFHSTHNMTFTWIYSTFPPYIVPPVDVSPLIRMHGVEHPGTTTITEKQQFLLRMNNILSAIRYEWEHGMDWKRCFMQECIYERKSFCTLNI